MYFVTNLFPVTGVQNLSRSVKIWQSYWQKFPATFLCPTVHNNLVAIFQIYPSLGVWTKPQSVQSSILWASPKPR